MITQCPKTGRTCEVTGCNGCWKDSTTQDEIIRSPIGREQLVALAREAGFEGLLDKAWGIEQLKRFAALVAAHEREACAKVCEEFGWYGEDPAAAIRNRSNT